jgi:hypothetical protein
MYMLNINKWITFMLQNQFFEIMEDVKMNNESDKPAGSTPESKVSKPAAGTTGPAGSTAKSDPAKTPATSKTPAAYQPSVTNVAASKTTSEKQAETINPAQKKAPVVSARAAEKISKKLAKSMKKLKNQEKEITLLEKNRDRLMKDLISAIENKKKSKKITNLARDFNRIETRVKKRTASYLQKKKELIKKGK